MSFDSHSKEVSKVVGIKRFALIKKTIIVHLHASETEVEKFVTDGSKKTSFAAAWDSSCKRMCLCKNSKGFLR